jgi:hypothetical protein
LTIILLLFDLNAEGVFLLNLMLEAWSILLKQRGGELNLCFKSWMELTVSIN